MHVCNSQDMLLAISFVNIWQIMGWGLLRVWNWGANLLKPCKRATMLTKSVFTSNKVLSKTLHVTCLKKGKLLDLRGSQAEPYIHCAPWTNLGLRLYIEWWILFWYESRQVTWCINLPVECGICDRILLKYRSTVKLAVARLCFSPDNSPKASQVWMYRPKRVLS